MHQNARPRQDFWLIKPDPRPKAQTFLIQSSYGTEYSISTWALVKETSPAIAISITIILGSFETATT